MKRAFTLVELLMVIAIVGILATLLQVSFRSSIDQAKAVNIARELQAIQRAFEMKALNEKITEWWPEDDLPTGPAEWGSYIELFGDGSVIENFLPIAPDAPNYTAGDIATLTYYYDNDKDWNPQPHQFTDPADCHAASESNRQNAWNGVNILFELGIPHTETAWMNTATYLDNAIDRGDGFYCGKFRADNHTQSRFFL